MSDNLFKNSNKSKYSLPDKSKFYDSSNEYDFDNGKEFATAWNKYGKEDFQNMPDKPYGELGKSRSDTDKNQNMNIKTPYIGTDTISNTSFKKTTLELKLFIEFIENDFDITQTIYELL